jgi:hypothetical protein
MSNNVFGWNVDEFRDYNNSSFFFARFDDWSQFMRLGTEYNEEMRSKYRKYKKFYDGYNWKELPSQFETKETKTIEDLNKGFFKTYMEEKLLKNVLTAFDEILADIDMGGSFKKSKLIITDKTRGIFDFGLASLGLFAEQEFFSEKLAEESPLEFPKEPKGVVPPLFVNLNQLGDYWYVSSVTGKKYKMTRQDKGTQAAIYDGFTKENVPLKFKSFKTKQKKSYLEFKKEGGKSKFVDLYVPMGGLGGMTASGMLQRALPLFMAAEFFESVGIRTRVNCARVWSSWGERMTAEATKKDDGFSAITVGIKDFGEDLDFTRLAVAVADERTYRYNMWKLAPAITAKYYKSAQRGAGSTLYGRDPEFNPTTRRFKNWYYEQIEKYDKDWVQVPKPLMIFGGVADPLNRWKYTGDKEERGYRSIVEEFYRILDTVDFYFNKPEAVCQRIYDRWVETGEKSIRDFKKYCQSTLANAFSIVENGEYSDPEEEKEADTEAFNEKCIGLRDFLISVEEFKEA